jgi:galactosyl transferase GMA12/MNN10 family
MSRNLLIVARTCTRVFALNGNSRYINVSKHELVNKCLSSLVNSVNQVYGHEIKLIVLDDHSDPVAIADIRAILANCKFPTEFIPVEDGTGNGHTMFRVYDQVEKHATDLWYHVEDDYLHVPSAIQDMIDSVDQFESNTGKMVAINPHDDVFRYTDQIYHSVLLLGPNRHYRTVLHTTYTCLASRAIYDKYRQHFQNVAIMTSDNIPWVENKSINLVWNQPDVLLFSPIPGLAFHIMETVGKDPYVDIDEIWDNVPMLWKSSNKSTFAVVSIFNDAHTELAELTWDNNKIKYAEKHNYLAVAKTNGFSPEQVHFDKFLHILDVMENNTSVEWIWWLDNDAMITNFDIKLEDLIDEDYHVIISTDIAALNTGSFIVRNSIQSKNWLRFLLSRKSEYKHDKKWYEQQAVIDFYPKFQDLFKIIPQKLLNSYDYGIYGTASMDLLGNDGQWSEGDFVIHWPGLNNVARKFLATHYQQFIKGAQ